MNAFGTKISSEIWCGEIFSQEKKSCLFQVSITIDLILIFKAPMCIGQELNVKCSMSNAKGQVLKGKC